MKGLYPVFLFLMVFVMLCSPLRLLNFAGTTDGLAVPDGEGFLVECAADASVSPVSEREYVIGVVAGEMSPDGEPEALKAQAVAAYTYAKYKQSLRREENRRYDVTDTAASDQCYRSQAEQVALWQDKYAENRALIEAAVDAVLGETLTYEGKPILAVYHSASSGKTENAADVWGREYPCLVSVESTSDLLSPEYLGSVTFSAADFAEHALDAGVTLVGDPAGWAGAAERSGTGSVKSILLGGTAVSGTAVRSAFGLNSCHFDLTYADGSFTFETRGKGHGVGMSQFGASHMASQGSTYREILAWYYPGAVLKKP